MRHSNEIEKLESGTYRVYRNQHGYNIIIKIGDKERSLFLHDNFLAAVDKKAEQYKKRRG